jgi:hypothetical protein
MYITGPEIRQSALYPKPWDTKLPELLKKQDPG